MKYLVIAGSPTQGFNYIGPFDGVVIAQNWAEQNERSQSWWISPLLDPASVGDDPADHDLADHRGAWGLISEALDAEALDEDFQETDLDEIDGARYVETPWTVIDLIMKAENEGLDTEMEFGAYIWALVTTGLINSTGSNQRIVADYSNARGEGWQEQARTAYETLFDGGPR